MCKDSIEGTVTAMRTILEQCERSKTVKRVIHTGSVVAASPLKVDGHCFKPFVDESCWTPLNLSYGYSNEILNAYVSSKTLSEKELLRYNDSPSKASFEVVTLLCGLVAGDTVLPYAPGSIRSVVSPLTGDEVWHGGLKFMQALLGAVPVVHVDDACEAHVFFMECPAPVAGRFLCAAGHLNMRDIVDHYGRKHPELKLRIEEVVGEGVSVQPAGTSKLMDMGFKYRYGVEEIYNIRGWPFVIYYMGHGASLFKPTATGCGHRRIRAGLCALEQERGEEAEERRKGMGDDEGKKKLSGGPVVCVTGGGGYIGSWLVRKLLARGCVVHATLRSYGDEKTGMLRALPGAAERLRLFQADMYDADTFEPAITGCEFVFLVATPLTHDPTSTKYKNTTEAAVDAARIILRQCERSGTVKRVIHTASVTAASPLREDGTGSYKDFIDESCWTPLNLSYGFSNAQLEDYVRSKSLSEKELLSYNERESRAFEVVTLACGLVGGDTIQPYLGLLSSISMIVAPLTGHAVYHNTLLFLQSLLGSVPLAHVEDVCEAHAFCMDQPSMAGRFLCAAGYPNVRDFLDRFAAKYPDLKIRLEQVTGEGVRVRADTTKLEDLGFRYRYGVEETIDCSVECAKRLGAL
ncbi:hypothetical protein HU200_051839 [Digitaria exilis]|uniref:NAD-dependent epimerase/dehydratase domain-containing protein n=1 Tax=Digitaria exilis TaxID=1010633 RepID=A0A835E670_9POAL|nr:hypothetical protein HU200_051839 [Digitaria exilis]